MPYKIRLFTLSILCFIILSLRHSQADTQTSCNVVPGVEYSQFIRTATANPLVINELKIDMKQAGIQLEPFIANNTFLPAPPLKPRETLADFTKEHNAVAGINGDFFEYPGFPVGITIQNGQLISDSLPWRTAFGITANNTPRMEMLITQAELDAADGSDRFIDGINRPLGSNQLNLLTPSFSSTAHVTNKATIVTLSNLTGAMALGSSITSIAGAASPGAMNAPISPNTAMLAGSGSGAQWMLDHIKSGDLVKIRFNAYPTPTLAGLPGSVYASRSAFHSAHEDSGVWKSVQQAISGGPLLVLNGKVNVDWQMEHFTDPGFVQDRAPRTAIGVTQNGNILLVTVDGRQSFSKGATLSEMASIMLSLGAMQAMNLDGGGSTSMAVNNLYVDSPSDGSPRPVAEALMVLATDPPITHQDIMMPMTTIQAGRTLTLKLPSVLSATDKQSVVWGSQDGRIFVDQTGNVQTTTAGNEEIDAYTSSSRIHFPITILPGPPALLTGVFQKEPNNPPDRNYLAIRLRDQYGNPIPYRKVNIIVSQGEVSNNPVTLDNQGFADVEIVWDKIKNRRATLSVQGLPVVIIK